MEEVQVRFKEGLVEAVNPVRDALIAAGGVVSDSLGGDVATDGVRMVCPDGRGVDIWVGTAGECIDVDVTWYPPGVDMDITPSEEAVAAQFPFGTPAMAIARWFADQLGIEL